MKKKIRSTLFLCLLFVLTGCGKQTETTTFLMGDAQEGEHPTAIACDNFAEMVNDRTDGRVTIEVYHGSTLGSEGDQLKQVVAGGLDFVRVSGQISNYEPKMKAFQSLYLFNSEDDMWNALSGSVGDELLNSQNLLDNNLEGLAWFSGGSRNFYNNQKEVTCPADLAGLKLRANTDVLMALLEENGASGINVAYNDIYQSITEGVIDGAENNWPSYISTEHYKVAKYITIDQHCCIPEMIIASKSAMDSISAEDQQIIRDCAKEISTQQIKAMKDYEAKAIETAEAEGCTITYLSDEALKEFQQQGEAINQEIFADYIDYMNEITGK